MNVEYREVLAALEEETARQIADIEATARRTSAELLEATRCELEAAQARVVDEARKAFECEASRVRGRARVAAEREVLVTKRRLLDELQREAEARVLALHDDELVARLADELVAALDGEGRLEFSVDAGAEEPLRRHLAERHPQMAARASVTTASDQRGGVAVLVGGRHYLDNTLAARFAKAWPRAEAEIAAVLFRETDGER